MHTCCAEEVLKQSMEQEQDCKGSGEAGKPRPDLEGLHYLAKGLRYCPFWVGARRGHIL